MSRTLAAFADDAWLAWEPLTEAVQPELKTPPRYETDRVANRYAKPAKPFRAVICIAAKADWIKA